VLVTDGPAVCDNHPSTTGQWTWLSCHEFGCGNDWAKILKSAMHHGWAARKRAPYTMGQPTLGGVYGAHGLCPLVLLVSCNLCTEACKKNEGYVKFCSF